MTIWVHVRLRALVNSCISDLDFVLQGMFYLCQCMCIHLNIKMRRKKKKHTFIQLHQMPFVWPTLPLFLIHFSLSLFTAKLHHNCSSELLQFILSPFRRTRSTCQTTCSHPNSVQLPNPKAIHYYESYIYITDQLWTSTFIYVSLLLWLILLQM